MKPYYSDESVILYNADCRDVLPAIESCDAFMFTDPPYNVGKDYGTWNDSMSNEDYLLFTSEWISQAKRICKSLCVFAPNKYLLKYWNMLGEEYKQVILTWAAANSIRGGWESKYSVLLTNAKPQKIGIPNWWPNTQRYGLGYLFREDNFGHPGYTSEDITGRVLSFLAEPNSLVIDPFAGTGTTLRIAKNLGRRAIGIEVNREYCDIIVNRMRQTVMSLPNNGLHATATRAAQLSLIESDEVSEGRGA